MVEIIEDNLDVDVLIGGENTGENEQRIRQRQANDSGSDIDEWGLLEAEIVLSRRNTPNYADIIITPQGDTVPPSNVNQRVEEGGLLGATFTLDVDTSIRTTDLDEEVTRLFTGKIANMTPIGDYTYEAIVHDPTQEPFKNVGSDTASDLMNQYITLPYVLSAQDQSVRVDDVLDLIMRKLEIPPEKQDINIQKGGISIGTTPDGEEVRQGYNTQLRFSDFNVTVEDALTKIEEASESYWWFDRFGVFNFGPLQDITSYDLSLITDTSAGASTPAYRSVKVIGDGVVSEEGWQRSSLIADTNISSEGNVSFLTEDAQLAEPTFIYRNMEISTASEAQHVRNQLIDKLRSQRANGKVTVVGFPEIYPNDTVVMPSSDRQPMGGSRYGVMGVTHRINPDDGFVTIIEVQGLTKGQEAIYNEDVRFDASAEEVQNALQGISPGLR